MAKKITCAEAQASLDAEEIDRPGCRAVTQFCGGRLERAPNHDCYYCVKCGKTVSRMDLLQRVRDGD